MKKKKKCIYKEKNNKQKQLEPVYAFMNMNNSWILEYSWYKF